MDYLAEDPYRFISKRDFKRKDAPAFILDEYVSKMKKISTELEEYTYSSIPKGSRFIGMVEESGMNLEFCITSALGTESDTRGVRIVKDTDRLRVIDPFLWALALDKKEKSRSFILIYEDGKETPVITELWKELSNYGKIKVHYFGNSDSISQPGEKYPAQTLRPRLIGPILEKSDPTAYTIIFSNDFIIDLQDIHNMSNANKVFLVTDKMESPNWGQVIYSQGNDAGIIVEKLLSMKGDE